MDGQNYPVQQPQGTNGMAVVSLVMGIISLVICCCGSFFGIGCVSLLFSILGLVFGIVARKQSKSGMATAGIVCSLISLIITIVLVIILIVAGVGLGVGLTDFMEMSEYYY